MPMFISSHHGGNCLTLGFSQNNKKNIQSVSFERCSCQKAFRGAQAMIHRSAAFSQSRGHRYSRLKRIYRSTCSVLKATNKTKGTVFILVASLMTL